MAYTVYSAVKRGSPVVNSFVFSDAKDAVAYAIKCFHDFGATRSISVDRLHYSLVCQGKVRLYYYGRPIVLLERSENA